MTLICYLILKSVLSYRGVFGDGPSNAANLIFSRPTPVAMATKFGTKLAITRLAKEISARCYLILKSVLS